MRVKIIFFVFVLYTRNVLVALDQLANAVLLGDPDETLSSRFGKNRNRCSICRFICFFLDKIDKRHCSKSIERDEGGRDILKILIRSIKNGII